MADATADEADVPQGKSKKGLVIGILLALIGGGASFAVTSGMVSLGGGGHDAPVFGEEYAFIPLEPMTIPINGPGAPRHLRFRAELEVDVAKQAQVQKMLPRVIDVLNTYLRSLSMIDVQDPSSLLTLRAQMRRRIDLVVGGDAVHDLLVMEFVVN